MDQQTRLAHIRSLIHAVLEAHPDGLSEYDLLSALATQGVDEFAGDTFADSLSTFQTHFLLFHCLYGLRDSLFADRRTHLEIHCLNIRLRPIDASTTTLPEHHDPLRDYYGDLSNLANTTAADVEALLTRFWRRFTGYDQHEAALQVLELEAPVTFDEIKMQYRRLVMTHHPDRGGDNARLQAINEAMRQLKNHYD